MTIVKLLLLNSNMNNKKENKILMPQKFYKKKLKNKTMIKNF